MKSINIPKIWRKKNVLNMGFFRPFTGGGNRGGCWFCMNTRIKDFAKFKLKHPNLWNELIELSKTPNLCSYGFKYGMTVQQVDEKINAINAQGKLFED